MDRRRIQAWTAGLVTALLLGSALVHAPLAPAQLRPNQIEGLLKALNDKDYKIRLQACIILARQQDYRSVPALIDTLKDSHHLVRGLAAHALGQIGDTRAIAPLRKMRSDRSSLVRKRVRFALELIRRSRRQQAKKKPRFALRLVSISDTTRKNRRLLPELRNMLRTKIQEGHQMVLAPQGQPGPGQRVFEVTAAIARLTVRRHGRQVKAHGEVSLVLAKENGGIVSMTTGEADAEEVMRRRDRKKIKALKIATLQGAVNGAFEHLATFLAKQ